MNLFISFLLLSATIITQAYADDCTLRNKCECVYADGSGWDLKPVVSDDGYLEAFFFRNGENLTFFYHPCGDSKTLPVFPKMNETDNSCKLGYTLCMINATANKAVVLGKQSNMEFKKDGDIMQVIFAHVESQKKTSISLECTPFEKKSVLYSPSVQDSDQISLSMFSPFACQVQVDKIVHHGMFYTFFIVILTLLFAYLFFGILINYFFIGARGYELIPNYDFWRKVWKSMKLGFIYIKNGCRVLPADDAYDAI